MTKTIKFEFQFEFPPPRSTQPHDRFQKFHFGELGIPSLEGTLIWLKTVFLDTIFLTGVAIRPKTIKLGEKIFPS